MVYEGYEKVQSPSTAPMRLIPNIVTSQKATQLGVLHNPPRSGEHPRLPLLDAILGFCLFTALPVHVLARIFAAPFACSAYGGLRCPQCLNSMRQKMQPSRAKRGRRQL
jgi:hypothetical protein